LLYTLDYCHNNNISYTTEDWYLVQFEDEGQFFSVLPPGKVRHISPADMHEAIDEGDYVDAEWPADGKEYDAI